LPDVLVVAEAGGTIGVVWELSDAVPDQVKAWWLQRVVAAYEAGQYAAAFEEAFRVIELAAVTRSREAGGPSGFSNAGRSLRLATILHCPARCGQ
jgi:hypothetical protein